MKRHSIKYKKNLFIVAILIISLLAHLPNLAIVNAEEQEIEFVNEDESEIDGESGTDDGAKDGTENEDEAEDGAKDGTENEDGIDDGAKDRTENENEDGIGNDDGTDSGNGIEFSPALRGGGLNESQNSDLSGRTKISIEMLEKDPSVEPELELYEMQEGYLRKATTFYDGDKKVIKVSLEYNEEDDIKVILDTLTVGLPKGVSLAYRKTADIDGWMDYLLYSKYGDLPEEEWPVNEWSDEEWQSFIDSINIDDIDESYIYSVNRHYLEFTEYLGANPSWYPYICLSIGLQKELNDRCTIWLYDTNMDAASQVGVLHTEMAKEQNSITWTFPDMNEFSFNPEDGFLPLKTMYIYLDVELEYTGEDTIIDTDAPVKNIKDGEEETEDLHDDFTFFINKSFKVNYDSNGKDVKVPIDNNKYKPEDKFTTLNLKDTQDYKFIGWSTNKDLDPVGSTKPEYKANEEYSINQDLKLYAIWEEVIIDDEGGDEVKPEKPKVDPPKVDPPKVDPPKVDPPKVDPPKVDPPKVDPPKIEDKKEKEPPIENIEDDNTDYGKWIGVKDLPEDIVVPEDLPFINMEPEKVPMGHVVYKKDHETLVILDEENIPYAYIKIEPVIEARVKANPVTKEEKYYGYALTLLFTALIGIIIIKRKVEKRAF